MVADRHHFSVGIVVAACMLAVMAGCQTTRSTSDGRPLPPPPRPALEIPAGAVPSRMTLLVGPRADDSDGNGSADTVHAVASLFAYPHPTAMDAGGGAFVFTLYRQGDVGRDDAKPLGTWRFEGEKLAESAASALYGRCYQFKLSLLDEGTDQIPLTPADLRGQFEPAGGESPVRSSDEMRLVQVGRR